MSTWFLLSLITGMYIGPMSEQACRSVEPQLLQHGVVCKQAAAMKVCPVPGHPEAVTACPDFDIPRVTLKP